MPHDPAGDDAVVEVNFGAGTLSEPGFARFPAPPPRTAPSLVELLATVLRRRWIVAAVTLAVSCAALAYLFVATPQYGTSLVLQIEDRRQRLTGLEDLSEFIGEAASPAETEIEIMRSRTLIGTVVDELGLDVGAAPRRAPLIGAALARRWSGAGPAPARFGFARYGWGGERIRVTRLEVAEGLVGSPLLLTALGGGRYRLADAAGAVIVEGAVGERAEGGDESRHVALVVGELVARPGTEFSISKLDRSSVISGIVGGLRVAETAKKTGVLVATLEGSNPRRITEILNAIGRAYLKRNVDRKSTEAQQMLAFLESQLPTLKENVDSAEAALNAFQRDKHAVDMSAQTESLLGRAVNAETALQELQMQLTDLRQRFTPNHPAVVAVQQKIARMQAQRASVEEQMRAVPERELDVARLTRDVKVASELYVLVLNKAQELKVARSGVVGNVTILDPAEVPGAPSRPQRSMVLSLALLLGLGLGVGVALVLGALDEGSDDPEEIEARTGLPVFVTVPHSELEARLQREARRMPRGFRAALAEADPTDLAVEGLRSLRTALQFALVEARNNVIALGAPAPGVGKSFVSVNLALLLASAGRRVLLVDGDLRRGRAHRYFSLERSPGLSDVVSGDTSVERALRHTMVDRLDVLSTGRIPPNPAELLASHRFQQLLAEVSRRYDLVIVDTPPVLAVTDPAIIARHAGVNLLVVRAGVHPIGEIVLATKQLAQAGVKVQGTILNDLQPSVGGPSGRYGLKGSAARYEYRSDSDAT